MDPSELFEPLLHLWYFIPLVLLLAILRSPWFKGHLGEFFVNASARLFLDKDRYHLIKNVSLPTEDGTTQIDHVIVSRYGVFTVEMKNTKGESLAVPNRSTGRRRSSDIPEISEFSE